MDGVDALFNILIKTGPTLLSNVPKGRKEASPDLILIVNKCTSDGLKGSENNEATLYIQEKYLDVKQSQHSPDLNSYQNVLDALKKSKFAYSIVCVSPENVLLLENIYFS